MKPPPPSTENQSAERSGTLILLIAAALWSLNGLLIKALHADGDGLGGWSIAGFRSLIAAVFLAPLAFRRWQPIPEPRWVAGAVLFFTGMCVSFVVATTMTSAANAIILQYTAPAWVFLFSPIILGDRTEPRHWVAFAVSMSAVALIFAAQYTTDAAGLFVGLLSGLVFGCQGVLFRRVRRMDPVVMAFLSCAVSGVLLTPAALVLEGWRMTAGQAGLLILMSVVQFALPYVLYSAGVKHVSAQRAVLLIMLEPVLNPVWVLAFRGEVPHWATITGGAAILASVVYLSLPNRTKFGRAREES